MNGLPLWPPLVALGLALLAYGVLWIASRRLDREAEELRHRQHPAE
jgi:hypothetical protein